MLCEKINLFEDRSDVTLTTYILDDSMETLCGKSRGAILICPGGAYLSCSDREAEPIAMAFAAMGYHAFVLRYSTHSENKPGYFPNPMDKLEVKEHCVFPNPMRDIGRAILYIKDHAVEWHVDEKKIAICGFSAGGHNCAMYSVYWNKPIITDYFKVDAEKLRPAACIMGYPLTDYVFMQDAINNDPIAKGIFASSSIAFLGTVEPTDDILRQVSPAKLVDKDTPPTFLWATSEDSLVPAQHTTLMAYGLAQNKIPFELHIFERGHHGMSMSTQASAGAGTDIDRDVAKWIELCDEWLKKRFAFDLPADRNWEEFFSK